MSAAALKQFIISMGASQRNCLMTWDKLWAVNKAVVDGCAIRHTVLLADGLVPLALSNGPAEAYAEALFAHPKDESLGKKVRVFAKTVLLQADDAAAVAEGEEVTLMSWGNCVIRCVLRGGGGKVTRLDGELHLAGSVKATKKKLTWLAETPELVDVELVDYDHLLSKDKVEEEDDINQVLTPTTKFVDAARGEAALRQLCRGQVIQVERRGYYVCDAPYLRPAEPIRLLFVPDGKNIMGVKR